MTNPDQSSPSVAPDQRGDVACQATDHKILESRIMDSRIAKNEQEWWAKRHIEQLTERLKTADQKIRDMGGDILEVEADLAEAKKDRKRLDWLHNNLTIAQTMEIVGQVGYSPTDFRKCIDDAIASQASTEGKAP